LLEVWHFGILGKLKFIVNPVRQIRRQAIRHSFEEYWRLQNGVQNFPGSWGKER